MESKAGALRKGQPSKSKVVCSEASADTGAGERLQKVAKKSTMLRCLICEVKEITKMS